MKAFLVAVSSLCVCGILLCFFAYAMDRLPGLPVITTSQQIEILEVTSNPDKTRGPSTMGPDSLCSPCVERIAFVLEIV